MRCHLLILEDQQEYHACVFFSLNLLANGICTIPNEPIPTYCGKTYTKEKCKSSHKSTPAYIYSKLTGNMQGLANELIIKLTYHT